MAFCNTSGCCCCRLVDNMKKETINVPHERETSVLTDLQHSIDMEIPTDHLSAWLSCCAPSARSRITCDRPYGKPFSPFNRRTNSILWSEYLCNAGCSGLEDFVKETGRCKTGKCPNFMFLLILHNPIIVSMAYCWQNLICHPMCRLVVYYIVLDSACLQILSRWQNCV
jgi:hypothetical protein